MIDFALDCSQRASVTVLNHKNWIRSALYEYSIIMSSTLVVYRTGSYNSIVYPGLFQSKNSRP